MTVGVFMSIKDSYVPEAAGHAESLVRAVNAKLAEHGLLEVIDPAPAPLLCWSRSGLDHHGSQALLRLGELAGDERLHAYLLHLNPFRLVYVPRDLDLPEPTEHRESIWGKEVNVLVGSSQRLLLDLVDMSSELGIFLDDGKLTDEVAAKIDSLQTLAADEADRDLIENVRTAWLLMHEAALISIEEDVPTSLAG